MFIDIDKIITEYEKDKEGHIIKDPTSNNPIFKGLKIARETIRLNEVRSARPWHKVGSHWDSIDKDVCVLYMFESGTNAERSAGNKNKSPEIHIAESHESFSKRAESIQIGRKEST